MSRMTGFEHPLHMVLGGFPGLSGGVPLPAGSRLGSGDLGLPAAQLLFVGPAPWSEERSPGFSLTVWPDFPRHCSRDLPGRDRRESGRVCVCVRMHRGWDGTGGASPHPTSTLCLPGPASVSPGAFNSVASSVLDFVPDCCVGGSSAFFPCV